VAEEDSNELTQIAQDSMTSLRELMQEMRQSPLGRAGLVPTLESLVRDLRLDWGIRIDLSAPADLDLSPENQVILYQVAREAIVNALKHAQPTKVAVTISPEGRNVTLRVEDDGIGFQSDLVDSTLHFGVGLMVERARHAGGELSIHSEKGEGTLIEVSVPQGIQAQDLESRVPDSENRPVV
jgi:signal transduction histidine kinase